MKQLQTLEPFPGILYYTGQFMGEARRDVFAARPLTVTGLVKGLGLNLLRMNRRRIYIWLRVHGFLNTPELGIMSLRRHFTLRFWENWMPSRFRSVKFYRRLVRRIYR